MAGWGATQLAGSLSGGGWYVSGSDSAAAAQRVTHGFDGRGATSLTLVVKDTRHAEGDSAFAMRVRSVADRVLNDPGLKATSGYGYTTLTAEQTRASFLGKDHRTTLVASAPGSTTAPPAAYCPGSRTGDDHTPRRALRSRWWARPRCGARSTTSANTG